MSCWSPNAGSDSATAGHDSATAAKDLVELIGRLDVGPVHLTGQDISGATTFRVAATHPELVKSYTAIETGLSGFGFEMLADVTHGGFTPATMRQVATDVTAVTVQAPCEPARALRVTRGVVVVGG